MPDVCTIGSATAGGSCSPSRIATGDSLVRINGKPISCVGDRTESHTGGDGNGHTGAIVTGSNVMFVNGKPVAFVGCEIGDGCNGNKVVSGDPLVNINS